tara:strand:- start:4628 stop:4795 length:168 start_codon:yes stop_codon:yes gene_type:complete
MRTFIVRKRIHTSHVVEADTPENACREVNKMKLEELLADAYVDHVNVDDITEDVA